MRLTLPARGTAIRGRDGGFRGDPADPVDVIGPADLSRAFNIRKPLSGVRISNRVYDRDAATCECDITTDDAGWLDMLAAALSGKATADVRRDVTANRIALDPEAASDVVAFRVRVR